jgi:hypothetical protein
MQIIRVIDPHFLPGPQILTSHTMATHAPNAGILYVADSKAKLGELALDRSGCLCNFRQARGENCRICGTPTWKKSSTSHFYAGVKISRAQWRPHLSTRLLNQTRQRSMRKPPMHGAFRASLHTSVPHMRQHRAWASSRFLQSTHVAPCFLFCF